MKRGGGTPKIRSKDADGRDKPGHRGANDSVPAERARGGRWRRSPLRHLHAGALSPVERPGNRRLADHAGTRTGHVADVSVARLVDQLVDEARAGEGRSASGSRLRRSRRLHGGRTQSAARESAAPAPLRAAGPDRISDPGLTARQPGGTLPLAYRPASIVTLRDPRCHARTPVGSSCCARWGSGFLGISSVDCRDMQLRTATSLQTAVNSSNFACPILLAH